MLDMVRAREHYEKALRDAGRIAEHERLLIQAAYAGDFGRADEAAVLYGAYLRLYPDDYSVRYTLATHLMQTRRYDDAVEQFKEVVRVWPAYAGAWVNLATCRTLTGKPAEALPELGESLRSGAQVAHFG